MLISLVVVLGGFLAWRVYLYDPPERGADSLTVEIAEKLGYKGIVYVYDEYDKIAEWPSASEYIVAAAVSPSGKTLTVATLSDSGCRIRVFGLGTGVERGSYLSSDSLYFELGYLSENVIFAIGSDRVTVFNSGPTLVTEYHFTSHHLIGYTVKDDGITLQLSGYRAGDKQVTVEYSGGADWIEQTA
jgi:hypothetical protein